MPNKGITMVMSSFHFMESCLDFQTAMRAIMGKKNIQSNTLPRTPIFLGFPSVRVTCSMMIRFGSSTVLCCALFTTVLCPQRGQAGEKYLSPHWGHTFACVPAFVPQVGQKADSNIAPQLLHLYLKALAPQAVHIFAESSFIDSQYEQIFIGFSPIDLILFQKYSIIE